jgi:hypothetical protein
MYYSIREAMGLTVSEVEGFGLILARANRKLNYRRVLGFKILGPGTSKRCEFKIVKKLKRERVRLAPGIYHTPIKEVVCGRRAAVGVLMEYNGKKFMIYLCHVHFKKFLDNMVKYVEHKAGEAYTLIMEKVNEVNPLADVEDISVFFQTAPALKSEASSGG